MPNRIQRLYGRDEFTKLVLSASWETLRKKISKKMFDKENKNYDYIYNVLKRKYPNETITPGVIRALMADIVYFGDPLTEENILLYYPIAKGSRDSFFNELNEQSRFEHPIGENLYVYKYNSEGELVLMPTQAYSSKIAKTIESPTKSEDETVESYKSSLDYKRNLYIEEVIKPAISKLKDDYRQKEPGVSLETFIGDNFLKYEQEALLKKVNEDLKIRAGREKMFGESRVMREDQNVISSSDPYGISFPIDYVAFTESLIKNSPFPVFPDFTGELDKEKTYDMLTDALYNVEPEKVTKIFGDTVKGRNKEGKVTPYEIHKALSADTFRSMFNDGVSTSLWIAAEIFLFRGATTLVRKGFNAGEAITRFGRSMDRLRKVANALDDAPTIFQPKNFISALRTTDYWKARGAHIITSAADSYLPVVALNLKHGTGFKEISDAFTKGDYYKGFGYLGYYYGLQPAIEGMSEAMLLEKKISPRAGMLQKIFGYTIGTGFREMFTEQFTDIAEDLMHGTRNNMFSQIPLWLGKGYTDEFATNFRRDYRQQYGEEPSEEIIKEAYKVYNQAYINLPLTEFLSGIIVGGLFSGGRSIINYAAKQHKGFYKDYNKLTQFLYQTAPGIAARNAIFQLNNDMLSNADKNVIQFTEDNIALGTMELVHGEQAVEYKPKYSLSEDRKDFKENEEFDTLESYIAKKIEVGRETITKKLNGNENASTYYSIYKNDNPLYVVDENGQQGYSEYVQNIANYIRNNVKKRISNLSLDNNVNIDELTDGVIDLFIQSSDTFDFITDGMVEDIIANFLIAKGAIQPEAKTTEETKDSIKWLKKVLDNNLLGLVSKNVIGTLETQINENLDDTAKKAFTSVMEIIKDSSKISLLTLNEAIADAQNYNYVERLLNAKKERLTKDELKQLNDIYNAVKSTNEKNKFNLKSTGYYSYKMIDNLEQLSKSPDRAHKAMVMSFMLKHREFIENELGQVGLNRLIDNLKSYWDTRIKNIVESNLYKDMLSINDNDIIDKITNTIMDVFVKNLNDINIKVVNKEGEEVTHSYISDILKKATVSNLYSSLFENIKFTNIETSVILYDMLYQYVSPLHLKKYIEKQVENVERQKGSNKVSDKSDIGNLGKALFNDKENFDSILISFVKFLNSGVFKKGQIVRISLDLDEQECKLNFSYLMSKLFYKIITTDFEGKEKLLEEFKKYIKVPKIDQTTFEKLSNYLTQESNELTDKVADEIKNEIIKASNNDDNVSEILKDLNNAKSNIKLLKLLYKLHSLIALTDRYTEQTAGQIKQESETLNKQLDALVSELKVEILNSDLRNNTISYSWIVGYKSSDGSETNKVNKDVGIAVNKIGNHLNVLGTIFTINKGKDGFTALKTIAEEVWKHSEKIFNLKQPITEKTNSPVTISVDNIKVVVDERTDDNKINIDKIKKLLEEFKELAPTVDEIRKINNDDFADNEVARRQEKYKKLFLFLLNNNLINSYLIPEGYDPQIVADVLIDTIKSVYLKEQLGKLSIGGPLSLSDRIKDKLREKNVSSPFVDNYASIIEFYYYVNTTYTSYDLIFDGSKEYVKDDNLRTALNLINVVLNRYFRKTPVYEANLNSQVSYSKLVKMEGDLLEGALGKLHSAAIDSKDRNSIIKYLRKLINRLESKDFLNELGGHDYINDFKKSTYPDIIKKLEIIVGSLEESEGIKKEQPPVKEQKTEDKKVKEQEPSPKKETANEQQVKGEKGFSLEENIKIFNENLASILNKEDETKVRNILEQFIKKLEVVGIGLRLVIDEENIVAKMEYNSSLRRFTLRVNLKQLDNYIENISTLFNVKKELQTKSEFLKSILIHEIIHGYNLMLTELNINKVQDEDVKKLFEEYITLNNQLFRLAGGIEVVTNLIRTSGNFEEFKEKVKSLANIPNNNDFEYGEVIGYLESFDEEKYTKLKDKLRAIVYHNRGETENKIRIKAQYEIIAQLNPYNSLHTELVNIASKIKIKETSQDYLPQEHKGKNIYDVMIELFNKIWELIGEFLDIDKKTIVNSNYVRMMANISMLIEENDIINNQFSKITQVVKTNGDAFGTSEVQIKEGIKPNQDIIEETKGNEIVLDNILDTKNPEDESDVEIHFPSLEGFNLDYNEAETEDLFTPILDDEITVEEDPIELAFPSFVKEYQFVSEGDVKKMIDLVLNLAAADYKSDINTFISNLTYEQFYSLLDPAIHEPRNYSTQDAVKLKIRGNHHLKLLYQIIRDKTIDKINDTLQVQRILNDTTLSRKDKVDKVSKIIQKNFVSFYQKEIRNRYNLIKSAKKQKVIKIYVNKEYGGTDYTFKVLPEDFKRTDGGYGTSRMPNPQLYYLIDELVKLINSSETVLNANDLKIVFVDDIINRHNNLSSKDLSKLGIDLEEFMKVLLNENYVYINRQGDKDTMLVLEISKENREKIINSLFNNFMILKATYNEFYYIDTDGKQAIATVEQVKEALFSEGKITNPELVNIKAAINSYRTDPLLINYLLPAYINELKYGNKTENLLKGEYILSNIDGRKVMKYGVLSSLETHNEVTPTVLEKFRNRGLFKENNRPGILVRRKVNGKDKVFVRVVVVNNDNLLNELGKSRLDGSIIGDSGAIGFALREIYGSNNFGNIKPYIYDPNTGLYIKSLLALLKNTPLTKTMSDKGIGLVISITTDKQQRIPKDKMISIDQLYSENVEDKIIEIDIEHIHRIFETGKNVSEVLGFAQLIHSTEIMELEGKGFFENLEGIETVVEKSIDKLNNIEVHKKKVLKDTLIRIQKEPTNINEIATKHILDALYGENKVKDISEEELYEDILKLKNLGPIANAVLNYINKYLRTTVRYINEGTTFTLIPDLGYMIHTKEQMEKWTNQLFTRYKEGSRADASVMDKLLHKRINEALGVEGIATADELLSYIYNPAKGYIHREFVIISEKEALINNINIGDNIINYIVPLDTADGAKTLIVAGISDKIADTTAIVNSEYIQALGKDYDADVVYTITQGSYSDDIWTNLTDTFWQLDKKFVDLMYKELIRVANGIERNKESSPYVYKIDNNGQKVSRIIRDLKDDQFIEKSKVVFDPQVAIAYCVYTFGQSSEQKAKPKIDKTNKAFYDLGYNYGKTISQIIQLRELYTFFTSTDTNIYIKADGEELIFNREKGLENYDKALLIFKYTSNHAVDYPNDSSKDYYVDNKETILASVMGIGVNQARHLLNLVQAIELNEMFNLPRFVDSKTTEVRAKSFVERLINAQLLLNSLMNKEKAESLIQLFRDEISKGLRKDRGQTGNLFLYVAEPSLYAISNLILSVNVRGLTNELNSFFSNKPIVVSSLGHTKIENHYLTEALTSDYQELIPEEIRNNSEGIQYGITPEFIEEVINFIMDPNNYTDDTTTVGMKFDSEHSKGDKLRFHTSFGITYSLYRPSGHSYLSLSVYKDRKLFVYHAKVNAMALYDAMIKKINDLVADYNKVIRNNAVHLSRFNKLKEYIQEQSEVAGEDTNDPLGKRNLVKIILNALHIEFAGNAKVPSGLKDVNKGSKIKSFVDHKIDKNVISIVDEIIEYEGKIDFGIGETNRIEELNNISQIAKNKLEDKVKNKNKVISGLYLIPQVDIKTLKSILSSQEPIVIVNKVSIADKGVSNVIIQLIEEGVLFEVQLSENQKIYVNNALYQLLEPKLLRLEELRKDITVTKYRDNYLTEYFAGKIDQKELATFSVDSNYLYNTIYLPEWFGNEFKYTDTDQYAYKIPITKYTTPMELAARLEHLTSGRSSTKWFNIDFNKLEEFIQTNIEDDNIGLVLDQLNLMGYRYENGRVVRKDIERINRFINILSEENDSLRAIRIMNEFTKQSEVLKRAIFTATISNFFFIKSAFYVPVIFTGTNNSLGKEIVSYAKGDRRYFEFTNYLTYYMGWKIYNALINEGQSVSFMGKRALGIYNFIGDKLSDGTLNEEYLRYVKRRYKNDVTNTDTNIVVNPVVRPQNLDFFNAAAVSILRSAIVYMNRFLDSKIKTYREANIAERDYKTFLTHYVDRVRFQAYLPLYFYYGLGLKPTGEDVKIKLKDGSSIFVEVDKNLNVIVKKQDNDGNKVVQEMNNKLARAIADNIDYADIENLENISYLISAKSKLGFLSDDQLALIRNDMIYYVGRIIEGAFDRRDEAISKIEALFKKVGFTPKTDYETIIKELQSGKYTAELDEIYDLLITSLDRDDKKSIRTLLTSLIMTQQASFGRYRAGDIMENANLLISMMSKYDPDLLKEYALKIKEVEDSTIGQIDVTEDIVTAKESYGAADEELYGFEFPSLKVEINNSEIEEALEEVKDGYTKNELRSIITRLKDITVKDIDAAIVSLANSDNKKFAELLKIYRTADDREKEDKALNDILEILREKISDFSVFVYTKQLSGDYTVVLDKDKIEQLAVYVNWGNKDFYEKYFKQKGGIEITGENVSKEVKERANAAKSEVVKLLTAMYADLTLVTKFTKNKPTHNSFMLHIAHTAVKPLMSVHDTGNHKHLFYFNLSLNYKYDEESNNFYVPESEIMLDPKAVAAQHTGFNPDAMLGMINAFEIARYRNFRKDTDINAIKKKLYDLGKQLDIIINDNYSKKRLEFSILVRKMFYEISKHYIEINIDRNGEFIYKQGKNDSKTIFSRNKADFIQQLNDRISIALPNDIDLNDIEDKKALLNHAIEAVIIIKEMLALIRDKSAKAATLLNYISSPEKRIINNIAVRSALIKTKNKFTNIKNAISKGYNLSSNEKTFDYLPSMYAVPEYKIMYYTDENKIKKKIEKLKNPEKVTVFESSVLAAKNNDYRAAAIELLKREADKATGDLRYFIPLLSSMYYELDPIDSAKIEVADLSMMLKTLSSQFIELLDTTYDQVNYAMTLETLRATNDDTPRNIDLLNRYISLGYKGDDLVFDSVSTSQLAKDEKIVFYVKKEMLVNGRTVENIVSVEGYFQKVEDNKIYLKKFKDSEQVTAYENGFIYYDGQQVSATEYVNRPNSYKGWIDEGKITGKALNYLRTLIVRFNLGYIAKYGTALFQALAFAATVVMIHGKKFLYRMMKTTPAVGFISAPDTLGYFDKVGAFGTGSVTSVNIKPEELNDMNDAISYILSLGNSAVLDAVTHEIASLEQEDIFSTTMEIKEIKKVLKNKESVRAFTQYIKAFTALAQKKLKNGEISEDELSKLRSYALSLTAKQKEASDNLLSEDDPDIKELVEALDRLAAATDELKYKRVTEKAAEYSKQRVLKRMKSEKSITTTQFLESRLRAKYVGLLYIIARQYGKTHNEAIAYAVGQVEQFHAVYNSRARRLSNTTVVKKFRDALYHYVGTFTGSIKNLKKIKTKREKFIYSILKDCEEVLNDIEKSKEPHLQTKGVLRRLLLVNLLLSGLTDYIVGLNNMGTPKYMVMISALKLFLGYLLYDDDESRDRVTKYNLYMALMNFLSLRYGIGASMVAAPIFAHIADYGSEPKEEEYEGGNIEKVLEAVRKPSEHLDMMKIPGFNILANRNLRIFTNLFDLTQADQLFGYEQGDENKAMAAMRIFQDLLRVYFRLDDYYFLEDGMLDWKFFIANPLVPFGETLYIGFTEDDTDKKKHQIDENNAIREFVREAFSVKD
jgi:hypothetical protein